MSVPEDTNEDQNIAEGEVVEEGETVAESDVVEEVAGETVVEEPLVSESPGASETVNISEQSVRSAEPVLPQELMPKNTIYVVLLFLTLAALTLIIFLSNKEASEQYLGGFLPFL